MKHKALYLYLILFFIVLFRYYHRTREKTGTVYLDGIR